MAFRVWGFGFLGSKGLGFREVGHDFLHGPCIHIAYAPTWKSPEVPLSASQCIGTILKASGYTLGLGCHIGMFGVLQPLSLS